MPRAAARGASPLGGGDQILQESGPFCSGCDVLILRPLLDGVPRDRERNAPQLPGRPDEFFDGVYDDPQENTDLHVNRDSLRHAPTKARDPRIIAIESDPLTAGLHGRSGKT